VPPEPQPRFYTAKYAYEPTGSPEEPSEEYVQARLNELDELRAQPLPHETPLSDDEWAAIRASHEGLVALGEEVGIDVDARLPRREHYHMFDTPRDLKNDIGVKMPFLRAIQITDRGVLLVHHDDPDFRMSFATHETFHGITAERVEVSPETKRLIVGEPIPYTLGGGILLNEAITDMATHRAMMKGGHNRVALVYLAADLALDRMIRQTADAHDMSPKELETTLIRGAFTGDETGLNFLRETVGEYELQRFAYGKEYSGPRLLLKEAALHAHRRFPEPFSW
jgi:hypothetical protein